VGHSVYDPDRKSPGRGTPDGREARSARSIGKAHLTYGQGASAEMIAAATIMAADMYRLPVSTTHVLSSGVAGTMAANGSGLQWSTIRNIALAWVLTLPAAIILSATLYALFRSIV
jgi:inorganic phosphate transporter, PiT family